MWRGSKLGSVPRPQPARAAVAGGRGDDATRIVLEARDREARGAVVEPSTLALSEACIGLWERALASATVEPADSMALAGVTPAVLGLTGRMFGDARQRRLRNRGHGRRRGSALGGDVGSSRRPPPDDALVLPDHERTAAHRDAHRARGRGAALQGWRHRGRMVARAGAALSELGNGRARRSPRETDGGRSENSGWADCAACGDGAAEPGRHRRAFGLDRGDQKGRRCRCDNGAGAPAWNKIRRAAISRREWARTLPRH